MNTIVPAVALGVGVLLAGSLPWGALLAPLNLRFVTAVPWAVLPMAAYLWIYWKYIGGAIGSRDTSDWRRQHLRANFVSGDVWGMALVTGLVGFGALLAFVLVMSRMVTLPAAPSVTVSGDMPSITMFLLLIMASVVAGVTEEAGFRGYMQGPIERRYGLTAGIVISGVVFGLLHFPNHRDQVLTMLPYYVAVSAVYGGITAATNSILPSLFLHTGGDIWSLTRLWLTGRPEWEIATQPRPLVWETGVDTGFVVALVLLLSLAAATAWLCFQTARFARAQVGSTRSTTAGG